MKEAYVSYEVAQLLKKKGFAEPLVNYYYTTKGERVSYLISEKQYLCPTHQMTMAWLREVHNIDIIIFHEKLPNDCYWARIERNLFTEIQQEPEYNSYEDAVEAAIKYCLENLI